MRPNNSKIKCKNCKTEGPPRLFRFRTTHPFGQKSKGRTAVYCKRCGGLVR